jgi:hypothetical protein
MMTWQFFLQIFFKFIFHPLLAEQVNAFGQGVPEKIDRQRVPFYSTKKLFIIDRINV